MTAAPQTVAEPIPPATKPADRLRQRVSFFATVQAVRPNSRPTAAELLADIRNGRWREEVEAVRAAYRVDPAKADKLKRKLPGITFAGLFRTRSNGSLEKHSGLCVLDFDGLGDRLPDARRLLVADPHVLAVFLSPSGRGLKIIVPVDASDGETHRACFQASESHFQKLGLVADVTGSDVARLCFISHDPDAWIRPESDTPVPPFTPAPAPLSTEIESKIEIEIIGTPYAYRTNEGAQEDDQVLLARVRAEAQGNLEKIKVDSPVLADLYQRILEDRFDLGLHGRNAWLTAAVPFAFLNFSKRVACELALVHLRAYRALYQGDEAEHRASFESLWKGCEDNYPSGLSAIERRIYDVLVEPEKSAFRICRAFAQPDAKLIFYLGCNHLALRLGPPGTVNAWRTLRVFEKLGIITVVEKGHVRAKGQRSLATHYRWTLPTIAAAGATPGGQP